MSDFASAITAILQLGQRLDARGLAPASAGNYSLRLDDGSIAITVSGAHKGRLTPDQVMRVDAQGVALDHRKPSAETLLHALIYAQDARAGAVLHTHSIAGTVLSRALAGREAIVLESYELQKAFPGVTTHDSTVSLPLVDNSQDMPALAEQLKPLLGAVPAFYIRGHGLYAWGPTMEQAEVVAEACEFLLACAWEEWKAGVRS
ncbi:methylthioribulose 1-phosphate dehydratase [Novosphingobium terrae]|uniref:methylthioribulose 1-phosphate dehydratase n=1 Tax=Novosphingobium terrae TaxID=2726189 RepID=UPI00197CBFF7|nr:methylthioribulose 1-phosphate dehydratase [Novosphingobium terrae]